MKKFLFTIIFLSMAIVGTARPALAQTSYKLLAPIPLTGANSNPTNSVDFKDVNALAASYIPNLIKLAIGLAGGLAVIMIMVGGVEYITSATGMGKSGGKDRIEGAVIGLLLVIGAYTILFTVNPDLVKLDFSHLVQVKKSDALQTSTNYSYDANGAVTPCTNCDPVNSSEFPQKPAGQACFGTQCSVDSAMALKLEKLAKNFGFTNWQVTELYPPTVPHLVGSAGYSCHDVGTCVDATLTVSNPSPTLIHAFITNIQSSGFSGYVYEACDAPHPGFTTNRLTQLKSSPLLAGVNIQCYTTTTGENVHLVQ